MADHTIRAIPVVSANLWVLTLTDAPVINALGVVAAIAVRTTASINLTAHVINTPLSITAITILAATFNDDLILNAAIGRLITHLASRTGAIIAATDTLSIHRNTNTLTAFDFFTLRALGTISISTAGNQAQTVSIRANASHTVGA